MLPLERLDLIKAGLIYLHLERNGWKRLKTARTSGFAVKTVRAWVKKLTALGFEDRNPFDDTKPRKKKSNNNGGDYKERVFVSYEQN